MRRGAGSGEVGAVRRARRVWALERAVHWSLRVGEGVVGAAVLGEVEGGVVVASGSFAPTAAAKSIRASA